jgi:glutaredoxin
VSLPVVAPLQVCLYGRAGCCLCNEAEHLLELLHGDFDFTLETIDIDDDPTLRDKFKHQIPVVTINGGNRVALRVTTPRLRRAFQQAIKRSAEC